MMIPEAATEDRPRRCRVTKGANSTPPWRDRHETAGEEGAVQKIRSTTILSVCRSTPVGLPNSLSRTRAMPMRGNCPERPKGKLRLRVQQPGKL